MDTVIGQRMREESWTQVTFTLGIYFPLSLEVKASMGMSPVEWAGKEEDEAVLPVFLLWLLSPTRGRQRSWHR